MPDISETLARWGLTAEEAANAGFYGVDDASTVDPSYPAEPAVVLPYFRRDGSPLIVNDKPFTRIRRLNVPSVIEGFRAERVAKYLQPPGTGSQIYFPRIPGGDWVRVAEETTVPVYVTEGEAKALVASLRIAPTIALGGVYSFTDSQGKLNPDLESMKWAGRPSAIIYDSDALYNSKVAAAEARLAYELFYRLRAALKIVRLPGTRERKTGLDDYLRLFGAESLRRLIQDTSTLLAKDGKIIAMNEEIMWVESEQLVYDIRRRAWMQKTSILAGSKYSAETIATFSNGGGTQVTNKSVAKMWLTHPLARRVDEVLFRPGEGNVVVGDFGRTAMNLWEPQEIVRGDATPFVDLSEHLFRNLRPENRDLAVRLLAYKAQNPQEKVPMSIVLLGPQGSGKTLWADLVREAFGAYGVSITPKDLGAEFQGWLETAIVAVVNEIAPKELAPVREKLKALISDLRHSMNEKYRAVRQINSYTFYIITSNRRGVGAYDYDDRRMFVVDCPAPREKSFYDRIGEFKRNGGAATVYAYLMDYPLNGWRPPQSAPVTPEKFMARIEALTPVERLAEDMKTAQSGNVVRSWFDRSVAWAEGVITSPNPKLAAMGSAVLNSVRQYQVRPWYAPEELVNVFPWISVEFMGVNSTAPSPGRMSSELRDNGITYLRSIDDERGFMWRGRMSQFLVVAQFERWADAISQAEFDEYMRSWPTYGQLLTNARAT